MAEQTAAIRWMVAEVEGLRARLAGVAGFSSTIPMVDDAIPAQRALKLADAATAGSKDALARDIAEFLRDMQRRGASASLRRVQRRYLAIKSRFVALLTTVDIFADALTQRAEHHTGVALRGLDLLAEDGLTARVPGFRPLPIVCFLDRGAGGSVRRAFTRLPGGEMNAVALIKLPRERLFGVGLASLLHEVGHQGIATLHLAPAYVAALQAAAARGQVPRPVAIWASSKITEILPDLWACSKLGPAATLGLFAALGGTSRSTFRDNPLDPHPSPWTRGILSAEYGAATMPHPIWHQLLVLWTTLYPPPRAHHVDEELALSLAPFLRSIARTIAFTRVPQLAHQTLSQALASARVAPWALLPDLRRRLGILRARTGGVAPCVALATIGLARYHRLIGPDEEEQALRRLATVWSKHEQVPDVAAYRVARAVNAGGLGRRSA